MSSWSRKRVPPGGAVDARVLGGEEGRILGEESSTLGSSMYLHLGKGLIDVTI